MSFSLPPFSVTHTQAPVPSPLGLFPDPVKETCSSPQSCLALTHLWGWGSGQCKLRSRKIHCSYCSLGCLADTWPCWMALQSWPLCYWEGPSIDFSRTKADGVPEAVPSPTNLQAGPGALPYTSSYYHCQTKYEILRYIWDTAEIWKKIILRMPQIS